MKFLQLFLLLAIINSCTLPAFIRKHFDNDETPLQEMLFGWSDFIRSIDENIQHPHKLNGKAFSLVAREDGEWRLYLAPDKAFKIHQQDGKHFRVVIREGDLLFESSKGILRRKLLGGALVKQAVEKSKFDVHIKRSCVFPITFYQGDGKVVNFNQVRKNFIAKFVLSNAHEIEFKGFKKGTAIFMRKSDLRREEHVRLKLIDKVTREVYVGEKTYIPTCSPEGNDDDLLDENNLKNPAECLQSLDDDQGHELAPEKSLKISVNEIFYNRCARPLSCNFTYRQGLIKAGHIVATNRYAVKMHFHSEEKKHFKHLFIFPYHKRKPFDYQVISLAKIDPYRDDESANRETLGLVPYFKCHFGKE